MEALVARLDASSNLLSEVKDTRALKLADRNKAGPSRASGGKLWYPVSYNSGSGLDQCALMNNCYLVRYTGCNTNEA